MICSAVSNCAGLESWLTSPVCSMNETRFRRATSPTAPRSVPGVSVFGALEKPMWLSLICTKLKSPGVAASAVPSRRERGTPPRGRRARRQPG